MNDFERAKKVIPGGVNSPVRAFKSVGLDPVFIDKAQGPFLYNAQGKKYIDYVGSWGSMILGHQYPPVVEAVKNMLTKGMSFGTCTLLEVEWAERMCALVDSIDSVRMVNSGTEATMSAIRLARGYTQKNKIIKFRGCYHGHGDSFLIDAGSGTLIHGQPSSLGVTEGVNQDTLICDYNNIEMVETIFKKYEKEIATVIVEPIAGNMGVISPKDNFLQGLRNLCDQYQSLLILDEVMTGFRVSLASAQGLYGVKPDLTTFGKIIGGGMPVGAYGGSQKIMSFLSPEGPVYQAGTLSGNPLTTTAGLETLKNLTPKLYVELEEKSSYFEQGFQEIIKIKGYPLTVNRIGSMMTLFFTQTQVKTYGDAMSCDLKTFSKWFSGMLQEGIYLPPSQFEAFFISNVHTQKELDFTLDRAKKVLEIIY